MEEQSREVEARPPAPVLDGEFHLFLGDMEDDVSGYRRREAAWISILVHGAIVLALIFMPKWMPKSVLIVPMHLHQKENAVFVDSSSNPAKVKPPKSNAISDQNNRAQTRAPDKETLRQLADAGRPGPPRPPSPPPQPEPQATQGNPAPPQNGAPVAAPPRTTETARLESPQPKQNPFAIPSASSSVDQAIHAAATNRNNSTSFNNSGDRGSGIRPHIDTRGDMEILSDTKGVDFGPYMKRLKVTIYDHWYPLIPESAMPPISKKGRLIVEFAIMKDGTIRGMRLVAGSGDDALDTAAWGALTSAVPLDKLPNAFSGDYLLIRAIFYYNPDRNEFQ